MCIRDSHVTESPSHATKEKGERMIEARVLDLADRLRAIKEDKVLPLSLIHISLC